MAYPRLGHLQVGIAVEVDGVGVGRVEDVLGGGTLNHDSAVVAVVGLHKD